MFKLAQTFYIDKTVVNGVAHVTLDCVDLYFKSKPLSTSNRSGIVNPGASIFICATLQDDTPDVSNIYNNSLARAEYNEILASSDASIKTRFKFKKPLVLDTNASYGIIVAYDGDEDYVLWNCKEGETLVGTNTTTSGASAKNVGKYFEYTTDSVSNVSNWKSLTNSDLKFSVNVGKYANTDDISTAYISPSEPVEYIKFNRYNPGTVNQGALVIGEMMFKETPVIYGSIKVSNSSPVITSSNNINFSTLLSLSTTVRDSFATNDPKDYSYSYIVLRNGSTQAANVNVLKIVSIDSNTQITVDNLPKFSSNSATFSITAVGKLSDIATTYTTGRVWDDTTKTMTYKSSQSIDMLKLLESNANSTVRFANSTVESITINSGGVGYSNSDYVTVYPILNANTANTLNINYIASYANATANVVTNGSGTITGLAVTKTGYGLTSNVAIAITTSGGSTANLSVVTGSTVRGATSNAVVADAVAINIPVHRVYTHMSILNDEHQTYKLIQHKPYYYNVGFEHILNQDAVASKQALDVFSNQSGIDLDTNDGRVHVNASRSNEVVMASNVTISLANGSIFTTKVKSSTILETAFTSNNAFSIPVIVTDNLYNYAYAINNDTTGEIKGNGKALARHISTKVTFAEDRNAEDVLVYMDAYKPAGTNINVYARLHNRSDQEAFDDKDWTLLTLKSGNDNQTSSLTDKSDIIELTYGLPTCPATVNTISGDVNTTLNSATIAGVGSNWTADLAVNDVVKISSSLFPANYMVSVVRAISNTTSLVLDDVVVDTNLTASSTKISLIGRPAIGANTEIGMPFQAFSYVPNSHVCRYYDSAMSKRDTYNSYAIKIVLTTTNGLIVPEIENIKAIGVSA